MNNKYKAVLFDLDGTLLNSAPGVISSVLYTIDAMNFAPVSEDVLPTFVGPPIKRRFMELYGVSEEVALKAMDTFRSHYGAGDIYKAEVYEGLVELLEKLRAAGYQIGVATYKREDQAKNMLERFDLARHFDVIHGSDAAGKYSKTDIVRICIDSLGCSSAPSEAVMIGDSDNDAVGAMEVGAHFIGVTYGFGFHEKKDVDAYPNIGCTNHPLGILEFL